MRRGGQQHHRQRCGGKSRRHAARLARLAQLAGFGGGRCVVATIAGGNVGLRHAMVHVVTHGAGWLETVRGHAALEDNRQTQQKSEHQTHGGILDARHNRHAGHHLTVHGHHHCKATPPVGLMHINKPAADRSSIGTMRRWLLVLLVALLPLRSGAGDAMGTGMATDAMKPAVAGHLIIPNSIANYQESTGASGQFSSENSTQQQGDCPSTALAGHPHCQSCASCLACNTVALTVTVTLAPPPAVAAAVPMAQPLAFDSAIPHPGLKPPIS